MKPAAFARLSFAAMLLCEALAAPAHAQDAYPTRAIRGSIVVAGTAAEFDAYIRSETVKWARVVKAAGVKAE